MVQETSDISGALVPKYPAVIHDLAIDPDDGAKHDRFCELVGKMTLPQFQKGMPPFDTDGSFEFGSDGLPILQRLEDVPITVTLPKLATMPAAGYPLAVYFHGSGGLSSQVVDRGTTVMGASAPNKGEGPAFVLAPHGFATAGSALPVNPERLPGATATQYLNFNNLSSFRDIFRQGVIEQRLYIDALRTLAIPPSLVTACNLPALPSGATAYKFDPAALVAMGQSMGGMYTNMVGAVEPRVRAVVPTGAGGFWNLFITVTSLITNANQLLAAVLAIDTAEVTFVHPGLALLETAWEPAEPLVYMPRLAHRPLAGHPVRPVYEPVGKDDSYFPTTLYDAIAHRLRPSAGGRRGVADDAGGAGARRAQRPCRLPGGRQPAVAGGRQLHRRGGAVQGRRHRRSARDLRAARRGEVPVRLLLRDLHQDRDRGGAAAAAARHRLPAALTESLHAQ